MNIFKFRDSLINDFSSYIQGFINIKDEKIKNKVEENLSQGILWPDPLIQLNPSFEEGESIEQLVEKKVLHSECEKIFRIKTNKEDIGRSFKLHRHQSEAIYAAKSDKSYVLTTGTGSGKSLAYIIPIVDYVLRNGSGKGIKAIVIYPMNALANSQCIELEKFLNYGFPSGKSPVTFKRYTGQEKDEERRAIIENPPDILLTNYVMMELILTRVFEKDLVKAAKGLKFLVLDELHTYRGRQGADVAMLVRRIRDAFSAQELQCVGTSATLAGSGSFEEQRVEVARASSLLFGDKVEPQNVIGETLKRKTSDEDIQSATFIEKLKGFISNTNSKLPESFNEFIKNPLSIWIESTFGITKDTISGRLVRSNPLSISGTYGAAKKLSDITGVSESICKESIENCLLTGYYCKIPNTELPVFAFRLHQFISSGDKIYASFEPEQNRHITMYGQKYVPDGERKRILLPLVFCRECGQEYYCVYKKHDEDKNVTTFEPRELRDHDDEDNKESGFLYFNTNNPWPEDENEIMDKLPEDWMEEYKGNFKIKRSQKHKIPQKINISTGGAENKDGTSSQYFRAPFGFCLNCGVAYGGRRKSDFGKLASLGNEARSTATTILSQSTIRYLKKDKELLDKAKKLLSFTDNRQDASLQAGHFNDFAQISIIRAGVYKALKDVGAEGLQHDKLIQKIFEALDLPIELYANDPEVKFAALNDTQKALRYVLGYRVYRDLRRGWRVTSPNLEQCGLLKIDYMSLEELCAAQDIWQNYHETLSNAIPKTRKKIATALLDHMRRELSIKVDYLDQNFQEQICSNSRQRLIQPWGLDDDEKLEYATIMFPRSKRENDSRSFSFISAKSGFGQLLRRKSTFSNYNKKIGLEETEIIINQIFDALKQAGLVDVVYEAKKENEVHGYQIPAASIIWLASDGSQGLYDPIRVPNQSEFGVKTNKFFVDFYSTVAQELKGFEAHEHTAQVPTELREEREENFRSGKLPILYCSPTMELGIDIAELNVVNMRNVPPTPSNYAQRSGRAGRSGQPALVFTFCATGSPHDQYFFRRAGLIVSGSVVPPRIDLSNEDLIKSHINALWLSEASLNLGNSLSEVLDLTGDINNLPLKSEIKTIIDDEQCRNKALFKANKILGSISEGLKNSDWYSDKWAEETVKKIHLNFDEACARWRNLYKSATAQRDKQHDIAADVSKSVDEKEKARRLRYEAEAQIDLLVEAKNVVQSDFYSYRYFASEGFLPGYNFPRLPLSAYIPGRKILKNKNEFLSRPRFLAISEFGPQSIIYHEGSKYQINKVIMPVERDEIRTNLAKVCETCGYLHPISGDTGPDICESCGDSLPNPLRQLFRLQNVSTKRREKINSDEEERLKYGYEIKTTICFPERNGMPVKHIANVVLENEVIATLTYGNTATIWRINLGWKKRKNRNELGYLIDAEKGYWQSNNQETENNEGFEDEPLGTNTMRVIPFVEDRRNCLLFEPKIKLDVVQMISLQYALKNAIQVKYQLEDSELAVESLPDNLNRRSILFYEASEGGAGVLRLLLDDTNALSEIAKEALKICHFDENTGEDLKKAPRAKENCEAACYDCLMSYGNQRDHEFLDRQSIKEYLTYLTKVKIEASPAPISREEHLEKLMKAAGSELEKSWLKWLEERNLRLPSRAQILIEQCKTRPDFIYDKEKAAIYVDGPPHDSPERAERDKKQTSAMEDYGYTVIRFDYKDNWDEIIARFPNVFGRSK